MKKVILILLCVVAVSCNDFDTPTYSVDPQLTGLVDSFFSKMSERGYVLDKSNLIAGFNGTSSVASADDLKGQKYLRVSESIFKESQTKNPGYVQFHVFQALADLFIHKRITKAYEAKYNNIDTVVDEILAVQ